MTGDSRINAEFIRDEVLRRLMSCPVHRHCVRMKICEHGCCYNCLEDCTSKCLLSLLAERK